MHVPHLSDPPNWMRNIKYISHQLLAPLQKCISIYFHKIAHFHPHSSKIALMTKQPVATHQVQVVTLLFTHKTP